MDIDFPTPARAIAAQQLLWAADIDAVYFPDLVLDAPDADPLATQLFANRVRVPDADAARARRVLEARGLLR